MFMAECPEHFSDGAYLGGVSSISKVFRDGHENRRESNTAATAEKTQVLRMVRLGLLL